MDAERLKDGGLKLSSKAATVLCCILVHAHYRLTGPIKVPGPGDEQLELLRQMIVDSGIELETL